MTWFASSLAVFTAVACLFTAVADLRRDPRALETTRRLGIPDDRLRVLAAVKILAAAGLAAGLVVDRVLVLVSACLVLYFAIAVTAHVRVRDESEWEKFKG